MDDSKFRKLLGRYLNGDANETEHAMVDAFYRSYEGAETKQIDEAEKAQSKAAVRQVLTSVTSKETKLWYQIVHNYRVAASLLLMGTLAILFWPGKENPASKKIQYTYIRTKAGETKKLTLADSSELWLNSASIVRIPVLSVGKFREVYLDEGEALFQVRKNPSKPFIVHASKMDVRVLGTSFNVSSYKGLSDRKVQVITGRVEVSTAGKKLAILTPGQQLNFHPETQKSKVKQVAIGQISWTSGQQYLDHASFDELAMMLANHYGLQLKAGSKKAADYGFTMRMDYHQPVEEILKAISMIHNTKYRKEGQEIIIY